MPADIALGLDAVIVAVTEGEPRILSVASGGELPAIPSGPLDLTSDKTLERGVRRWVENQTGLDLGYVEQLYTFGDRDRRRSEGAGRVLSVAYLALVREAQPSEGAAWLDWYAIFPWEDHRSGARPSITDHLASRLLDWGGDDAERRTRVEITFGTAGAPWDPIRALERYELLYEAGLVAERYADEGGRPTEAIDTGTPLAFDHRRIAATALGRLRGKLSYRPVVFELLPETFTLSRLRRTVEALIGIQLHPQNFRRLVDQGRLVEGTGRQAESTGGRPAELFRFRSEVTGERPRPGVRLPQLNAG
jgi:hypothetical protein